MVATYLSGTLLACSFFIAFVQCDFYRQMKTRVHSSSVVNTLPNVTVTECVTSCLRSRNCEKSAFKKQESICLHLKSEKDDDTGSSVEVILFEPCKS